MNIKSTYIFWGAILFSILLFEYLVSKGILSTYVFAKPSQIIIRFWEMIFKEGLVKHILKTAYLSVVGALLGFLIGISFSLIMIELKNTKKYAEFTLDFIRSIPLTTLIPIFIAIYGIGDSPKIAIATVSAALTTAFTYYLGLKDVLTQRKDYFKLYKLKYSDKLKNVYFKDGITHLLTSLRLSISIALVLVIVSEMFIGTEYGLGRLVMDKSNTDDRAGMYAVVIITGVIGWLFNKITQLLQRKYA